MNIAKARWVLPLAGLLILIVVSLTGVRSGLFIRRQAVPSTPTSSTLPAGWPIDIREIQLTLVGSSSDETDDLVIYRTNSESAEISKAFADYAAAHRFEVFFVRDRTLNQLLLRPLVAPSGMGGSGIEPEFRVSWGRALNALSHDMGNVVIVDRSKERLQDRFLLLTACDLGEVAPGVPAAEQDMLQFLSINGESFKFVPNQPFGGNVAGSRPTGCEPARTYVLQLKGATAPGGEGWDKATLHQYGMLAYGSKGYQSQVVTDRLADNHSWRIALTDRQNIPRYEISGGLNPSGYQVLVTARNPAGR